MVVVRLAELEIDPARLGEYLPLLAEQIEAAVAAEPGVLALHAVQVRGVPAAVRVFEVYADEAAYQAHLTAPHFLKYKALAADMVRSLRLVETDPVILRAKPDPRFAGGGQ